MDLSEFVDAALQQILEGVRKAQSAEGGEDINATLKGKDFGGALIYGGQLGMFTRVDFDVAVSGQTSGKGGAKLTVFGVGAEAGGEHKKEFANRVKFSVPVRLPDGDHQRAEKVRKESEEKRQAAQATARRRSGREFPI